MVLFRSSMLFIVQRRKTTIDAHHHTETRVVFMVWRFKIILILLLAGTKSAFRLVDGNDTHI